MYEHAQDFLNHKKTFMTKPMLGEYIFKFMFTLEHRTCVNYNNI